MVKSFHLVILAACVLIAYVALNLVSPTAMTNAVLISGAADRATALDVMRDDDTRQLVLWSSDFHISTVFDIKSILADLDVRLIDKSLSGHCHLTHTCQQDLRIINRDNGIGLSPCPNQLRRDFYESYAHDNELMSVDGFLCTHASGMCELFMPFGKPLVIISSTRYEIGRHKPQRWKLWNDSLRRIASKSGNTVAANNRYDQEYMRYFTGLDGKRGVSAGGVGLIPSLCTYVWKDIEWTGYAPSRREVLVVPGRGLDFALVDLLRTMAAEKGISVVPLRDLYSNYAFSDLASHPAVVVMPYQVSFMLLFELYQLNVPIFVPSPTLLAQWHIDRGVLSERTWGRVFGTPPHGSPLSRHPQYTGLMQGDPNDEFNHSAVLEWVALADFYQLPHTVYFDSLTHLTELLSAKTWRDDMVVVSNKMSEYNSKRNAEVVGMWREVTNKIREHRTKSALSDGGRNATLSFRQALDLHYGLTLSRGCVGQASTS